MCTEKSVKTKWCELTFRNKIRVVYRNITVEPMLACYVIPGILAFITSQNLNLEKACRVNLSYSDEVCDALTARQTNNFTQEETQVQQIVAGMSVWKSFIQSLIPGVLIVFLGSWSDRRRRRKPFMLLVLIGDFISSLCHILSTYFFYQLSMEVTAFLECIFSSLTGGTMTMNMAVFSYLADITSVKDRTLRLGIANIFITAAFPIGIGLSGVLFHTLGFYGMYITTASLYSIGFVFGYLKIKDVNGCTQDSNNRSYSSSEENIKNTKNRTFIGKIIYFLKDLFDFQHIQETFATVFKRSEQNRRKRVVLLMVVLIVVIGPMYGEMTVLYLFMRYRFNWDEVQFSVFSTYSVITHLIGTSFSVGVFSHLLKIDDALIGVMSCMSKILAGFMYAFAQTEWQVYLAPLVDIVNGTSFIAMRSIASKLVPPEELGKLNSLYGACEALTPLLYGPMYAFVYAHTMDTMPGAFFLLGGALTTPAVLIFGWMYSQHRGDRLRTQASRKSSMADDMLKTLRVDPLAVTPTILDPSDNPEHVTEINGQVNIAFQDDTVSQS